MLVRQEGGHNNLAVFDSGFSNANNRHIIDGTGRIRTWNGSNCWGLRPPLPTGSLANEIASYGLYQARLVGSRRQRQGLRTH